MSLLRKIRVLVGALAHKPFMPRRETLDQDEGSANTVQGRAPHDHQAASVPDAEVQDTERVADLLAQRQRDAAD